MDEPAETITSEGKAPIFTEDMPCPRCEYNLRGLTQTRCPECGNAFNPVQVAEALKRRPPGPPLRWIVGNALWHPVAFWSLADVQTGWAPGLGQAALISLAGVGLALVLSIGAAVLRGSVGSGAWRDLYKVVLVMWPIGSAVTLVLLLLHERLCRWRLPGAETQVIGQRSRKITLCAAVWLMVALPLGFTAWEMGGYLGTMRVYRAGGFVQLSPAKEAALMVTVGVCLAGLVVVCGLWMVSLWKGTRIVGRGSAWQAGWCVLSNPYLILLAWGAVEAVAKGLVR